MFNTILNFKCPKCENYTLLLSEDSTLEYYKDLYLKDQRTLLPFDRPFVKESYLFLECDSCGHKHKVTTQEFAQLCVDHFNQVAWSAARVELGSPNNYTEYLAKYLDTESLEQQLSSEDLENNQFLKAILEDVSKKRS